MTETFTLDILRQAVAGHAAAFRCVTEYQPVGGIGDKVFPPTYEGGKYAVEKRILDGGEIVDCVLLDSVQSQANRMELALLEARRTARIELPLVTVRFDHDSLKKKFAVTSLEAPHRVADAILRDSLLHGVIFRRSEKGKVLDTADVRNATGLFGLCPTALVFGLWDSTGPRGGLGAKFQRALVSEMAGLYATEGCRPSSRIDPLQIQKAAGPVFRAKDGEAWTVVPTLALEKEGKKILWAKNAKGEDVLWDPKKDQDEGKPSKINHGNITPSLVDANTKKPLPGGFTISRAMQTTVLSLAALRRLRFPLNGGADSDPAVDQAARTVLAALGLLGAALVREEGADLRSRCQLFPTQKFDWELLDTPGEEPKSYALTGAEATALFNAAVKHAKVAGLPWEDEIVLTPTDDLIKLVARSQDLAVRQTVEGGE
ncbi:MAG: type I-U CRISPR-associated RAMP protein Csb1/Cas7u [Pseudomonadota bacterium]|nr:type I-U CRISPR-associated RAMP protein Csb1/Cas7u [Pseudomonadota bacterium]